MKDEFGEENANVMAKAIYDDIPLPSRATTEALDMILRRHSHLRSNQAR